jgi:catechol 2,3-dioxygenase-like lactoylglutathione lyase family enzyme
VTDLERSTRWYSELFAAAPVLDEDEPGGGFHHTMFALGGGQLFVFHTHPQAAGDRFDRHCTGLDQVAFACRDRGELQDRAARLDELGIAHGEIKDAHLRLWRLLPRPRRDCVRVLRTACLTRGHRPACERFDRGGE